jgi:H+/Na+-translocating ferredoxin:NAD+ oxidoreductase subunit G
MKDMLNLSLRLALICAVAAMALARVDDMTRGPIAEAEARAQREAVEAVLPAFAELRADTVSVGERTSTYFLGRDADGYTGAAFSSVSAKAYSGEIEIMVGVNGDGVVNGVRILKHAETPGLGAKYASPDILTQFYTGADLTGRDWRCRKDGGEVDAVTGATVTGRAILEAITLGLEKFEEDKDTLFAAPSAEEVR